MLGSIDAFEHLLQAFEIYSENSGDSNSGSWGINARLSRREHRTGRLSLLGLVSNLGGKRWGSREQKESIWWVSKAETKRCGSWVWVLGMRKGKRNQFKAHCFCPDWLPPQHLFSGQNHFGGLNYCQHHHIASLFSLIWRPWEKWNSTVSYVFQHLFSKWKKLQDIKSKGNPIKLCLTVEYWSFNYLTLSVSLLFSHFTT